MFNEAGERSNKIEPNFEFSKFRGLVVNRGSIVYSKFILMNSYRLIRKPICSARRPLSSLRQGFSRSPVVFFSGFRVKPGMTTYHPRQRCRLGYRLECGGPDNTKLYPVPCTFSDCGRARTTARPQVGSVNNQFRLFRKLQFKGCGLFYPPPSVPPTRGGKQFCRLLQLSG